MTRRTYSISNSDEGELDSDALTLRCDRLDDELIDFAIKNSDIKIIGQLSNSSNGALLGEISTKDDGMFSVVIKPSMYENPLIDFEWGTLAKREVAAYELSALLGWNIVPKTVLRDVTDLECSVQLFIPHNPREHYFTFSKGNTFEMEKFAVFDYLVNNADRKAGHIVREMHDSFTLETVNPPATTTLATGNFFGIDHGLTFNVEDKLRTVIWEFSEKLITQSLVEDMNSCFNRIHEILIPYLSLHEVEKTISRFEQLMMNPYHRALDASLRAFPWPLV